MAPTRGVPDQYQHVARTVSLATQYPTDILLKAITTERNPRPNNQNTAPTASMPMRIAESQEINARRSRAKSLHKQYPGMKNIPSEVTKEQKKSLVKRYKDQNSSANGSKIVGLNDVHTSASAGNQNPVSVSKRVSSKDARSKKHSERAAKLKRDYPVIAGLTPNKIGTNRNRAILDKHLVNLSSAHITVEASVPVRANLPARPQPPAPTQGTYPTRQHAALQGIPNGRSGNASALQRIPNGRLKNANARKRGFSNKMAPLTEERRAEVMRNLSGLSHDDPINLD